MYLILKWKWKVRLCFLCAPFIFHFYLSFHTLLSVFSWEEIISSVWQDTQTQLVTVCCVFSTLMTAIPGCSRLSFGEQYGPWKVYGRWRLGGKKPFQSVSYHAIMTARVYVSLICVFGLIVIKMSVCEDRQEGDVRCWLQHLLTQNAAIKATILKKQLVAFSKQLDPSFPLTYMRCDS